MNRLSMADKLALDKFTVDEGVPHIHIKHELCKACVSKNCLRVCPAGLYSEQDSGIVVEWAGCLECGTCRAVCSQGALAWQYPRGGFGISYRQG